MDFSRNFSIQQRLSTPEATNLPQQAAKATTGDAGSWDTLQLLDFRGFARGQHLGVEIIALPLSGSQ